MHDIIIVGSGPSGTAASLALKGTASVLMIDVGATASSSSKLDGNFYDQGFRGANQKQILGENFEYLSHLKSDNSMVKLRAPSYQYVTDQTSDIHGVSAQGFEPVIGYSKGGLANAWGCQLYEYFTEDLKGYPIRYDDLAPFYRELYEEIGIAGEDDDLSAFYGQNRSLLPPNQLSKLGERWLRRYDRCKGYLNKHGITIGRPRLGMDTTKHSYNNLEFVQSRQSTIYSPVQTLERLIAEGALDYESGYFVEKFEEIEDGVSVFARSIDTGDARVFKGKKLLLAAGAINSASLVLRSSKDTTAKLPILDNPLSYIPFLDPFSLGLGTQTKSYYNQLNLMYHGLTPDEPVMGTFYSINGLFNSEFIPDLPFDFRSSLVAAKYLLPAMMVLHLWYPKRHSQMASLSLNEDLSVHIRHATNQLGLVEQNLIKRLRGMGLLSHSTLCKYPLPGNSIHYAGTLPMRMSPTTPYECHPNGRLNKYKSVFVIDGASLSSLSSKNHSLTIMANAMRIAHSISI